MAEMREIMKRKDADTELAIPECLFHVTRKSRLESIMHKGLEPRAENAQDHFPPRVYLTLVEDRAVKIAFELRKAMVAHKLVPMTWSEDWVVLAVRPAGESKFWADGYSQGGVYTDQVISPDRISIAMEIPGESLKSKNWPSFWDDYFWGEIRQLEASQESQQHMARPTRMRM